MTPLFRWRQAILDSELRSTERLVALVLSTHMDRHGASCYPSLTTIARESGVSRRTVLRALAALELAGLLSVMHRQGTVSKYFAQRPDDAL